MNLDSLMRQTNQFGSQDELAHLRELSLLCTNSNPTFLEIGTWSGTSYVILGKRVQELGGKLYCLNTFSGSEGTDSAAAVNGGNALEEFKKNISAQGLQNAVIPVVGTSAEMLRTFTNQSFDLIYIDGDHRYSAVTQDIEICKSLLRSGGVICGHGFEAPLNTFSFEKISQEAEADKLDDVHCGVVLAVERLMPKYGVAFGIWSSTKSIGGWQPAIAQSEQKTKPGPTFLGEINAFGIYKVDGVTVGIHKDVGFIDFEKTEPKKFVSGLPSNVGFLATDWSEALIHAALVDDAPLVDIGSNAPRLSQEKSSERSVEFTGWLPAFKSFGNCGQHPQFQHINSPPSGYRFIQTIPKSIQIVRSKNPAAKIFLALTGGSRAIPIPGFWTLGSFFKIAMGSFRIAVDSLKRGAKPIHIAKFLVRRKFLSNLVLSPKKNLVFLPSVFYYFAQNPWVIEIEDVHSIFFPYTKNGKPEELDPKISPHFPIYQAVLASPMCRGIITHIKQTADSLPKVFQLPELAKKITHVPVGIHAPRYLRSARKPNKNLRLLFSSSWHQNVNGFFLRGGLDVLEAYREVCNHRDDVDLIIRCPIPSVERMPLHLQELFVDPKFRVKHLAGFQPKELWEKIKWNTDVFLLPSARIHVVSILEAMAYGMTVVASDGWGIQEYVEDGRTGVIIKGRYGKVSWVDENTGLLMEDYRKMEHSDPEVVDRLTKSILELAADRKRAEWLGNNARKAVETEFTLERWNSGLQKCFNQALDNDQI